MWRLTGGTNVIRAYAQDFAGNASPTNTVAFNYVVSGLLTLKTKGGGTVTPNLNGALLQIGKSYSLTAKAVRGSKFSNWSSDSFTNSTPTISFVMQSNQTFTANFIDGANPILAITSPKSGLHFSNSVFKVTGTAKDNDQVAGVWYQLNNGAWTAAHGTTNWTASVTLPSGTNTVRAYAMDPCGNISSTNSSTIVYVVSGQLAISMIGHGTLTPSYNGALLQIGKIYTMTAKAVPGYIFSNWVDNVGSVLTNGPTVTFTMQSNTVLGVNFTVDVHFRAQGNYAGLFFDTNNVTATNAGFFSATVTLQDLHRQSAPCGSQRFSLGQFSGGGTHVAFRGAQGTRIRSTCNSNWV